MKLRSSGGVLFPTFIPKQIISTEFYAILNGNKNHIAQSRARWFSSNSGESGTREDGGWNSVEALLRFVIRNFPRFRADLTLETHEWTRLLADTTRIAVFGRDTWLDPSFETRFQIPRSRWKMDRDTNVFCIVTWSSQGAS